jgi:hypothetical protein
MVPAQNDLPVHVDNDWLAPPSDRLCLRPTPAFPSYSKLFDGSDANFNSIEILGNELNQRPLKKWKTEGGVNLRADTWTA